jgi:ABC-type glycerol-3-phosphate transport system substrate-binding protein
MAAGSLGDAIWGGNAQSQSSKWAHLGAIRTMDDLVRAERFDPKQYFPAIVDGMKFEGKLMGLPFHGHPGFPFFFYNADLFQKRGVPPPAGGWTLDAVIEAGKRLSGPDAGGGPETFGWFSVAGYHGLIVLARLFGGDLLSADGRRSELAGQRTRQAIQWVVDARLRHRMEPTPDQLTGQGNVNDLFAQGRFGMLHGDSAQVSTMHTRIQGRFAWDIAMLPPGPGGRRGALTTPHIMGITSPSRQAADAWGFLKSYTGKEAGVVKALDGAGVPGGRPDAWNDPRILAGVPQYKTLAQAFEWAKPERAPANFRGLEVSTLIDKELAPILAGQEAVEAGTTRASTVLQALLDQSPG